MSRRSRSEHEDNDEIDLTPMLDVVFILLIFFIVTATFVKERGIDIQLPIDNEEEPPPSSDNPTIFITINANDEIWMEGRLVDVRAVRANIARMHAENPEAPVVVQADAKSSAKTFIAVADASREANVYNIALVPPEE